MDLLSEWIPWAALALVVVAVVACGIVTTLTPRRWFGALINTVSVAVASALVTVSAGFALNYYFAWYPDLADLFPETGNTAARKHGAGAVDYHGEVSRTVDREFPPLPSGSQLRFTTTIKTSVGGREWPVTIVLPDGYFDGDRSKDAYPVLFAAHGYPGSPTQFLGRLDIPTAGKALVDQKVIHPFILVIPSTAPDGLDTECVYGPDGVDQMEQWLTKDIPAWLGQHLRISNQRESWAWIGFSAGGWCSAMMAMLHPDQFGAGISLGGYYQALFEGSPPTELVTSQRLDLVALEKSHPPATSLYLQTAKDDKLSYPATKAFVRSVRSPTSVTVVTDEAGGHSMATWVPHLQPALTWLGRVLPGFRP